MAGFENDRMTIEAHLTGASLVLLAGVCLAGCSPTTTDPPQPSDGIQYVSPEQVGWSTQKLEPAKLFAAQSGYAAVMAAYEDKVFFSWGEVSRNYYLHSIRKPLLSELTGIHVDRGEISLDQTLEQLGIDDIPPSLTPDEKLATLRELMEARSGVYHEAAAEDTSMIRLRPARGSHPHGTFFYYNNWDFNVVGTIFRQRTGLDIFSAFKDEIGDPIGMQDFSTANCTYQLEPLKSEHPAYAFRMSARDLLRFGVLCLKGGAWQGRQIVPASWLTESTTTYSVRDSTTGVGYGYMWNTIPAGSLIAGLVGSSGFYHTGIGVHALIILPDLRLVIVERVDTDGSWSVLDEAGLELGMMIINGRL